MLLTELIGIEFPIASTSQKAYLFLKESEGVLLEAVKHFIKKTEEGSTPNKYDIVIALTKTINKYATLKKSETNFAKLKELYDFLAKNIKDPNAEIRNSSIEALCNLILLMDAETVMVNEAGLSNLMLSLIVGLQSKERAEDIKVIDEGGNVEDVETIDEAKKLKELCLSTTVSVVAKLDQNGNTNHSFLEPILSYFEEQNWKDYKMASALFVRIIKDFAKTQSSETVPASLQQIYTKLLDCLVNVAKSSAPIDERAATIERVLKVQRKIGRCREIKVINMYHRDVRAVINVEIC